MFIDWNNLRKQHIRYYFISIILELGIKIHNSKKN